MILTISIYRDVKNQLETKVLYVKGRVSVAIHDLLPFYSHTWIKGCFFANEKYRELHFVKKEK